MYSRLPSLNALRAFEAAARLGSIKAAANELYVTHGAISRHVKSLESELGVVLLGKDGRGVKLTDAGMRLRHACSESFSALNQVCSELKRSQANRPFVLGCSGSLLARWVIPRLDQLNRDLPELRLQLATSHGEPDPNSLEVDATLVFGQAPWPAGLEVIKVTDEAIGPVVSPRYNAFSALNPKQPTSLLEHKVLATSSRLQAWPEWCRAMGVEPEALKVSQHFEHLYFLLEAAAAGLGIAIAPEPLVADDILAGRLCAPWGFIQTSGTLALCVGAGRDSARAKALATWLSDMA